MSDLRTVAATAAQWWADQLLAPQPPLADQIGAEDDSPMRSAFATRVNLLAQATDKVDNPAQAEAFRDALQARILAELERHQYVTIGVDYDPDRTLTGAAIDAGVQINKTTLPFKTTMRVTVGGVCVSKGYGAPFVHLPLVGS
jgi:hypothetical protein